MGEINVLPRLANLLRQNGHDVVNGTSKLSLSMEWLNAVNEALDAVIDRGHAMNSPPFHVVDSCSEWNHCDTIFLHDFIQRASGLRLTKANAAAASHAEARCCIGRFRNLRTLEVHNVAVEAIDGIGRVAEHLQTLLCTRCLPRGGSSAKALLQHSDSTGVPVKWQLLKEATFTYTGLHSLEHFELMANLHSIDLSHNALADVSALNSLANLKRVNLAYNQLRKAPHFREPLCHRIQVLVLACNFIEDLAALAMLTNLRDLDVRENCLIEHTSLAPIVHVATLQSLNVSENPISYHPQHRSCSVRYLHANTASVCFVLDGTVLSKAEKRHVGSLHPRARVRTGSTASSSRAHAEKPRARIRNVTINDGEFAPGASEGSNSITPDDSLGVGGIEASMNHLETKRQIEELKDQFGNDWLKSQAGSVVQSVLGIGSASMRHGAEQTEQDLHAAVDDDLQPHEGEQQLEEALMRAPSPRHSEDEADIADGEENIFLATIKGEAEPVFIVITPAYILERDCSSVTEKMRWPANALTTCESDEHSVTIYFDTLKKHAKWRTYLWDEDESPRLLQALRKMIANRPEATLDLSVFKCLKCCSQFTLEIVKTVFDEQTKQCPTCASDLVFEAED